MKSLKYILSTGLIGLSLCVNAQKLIYGGIDCNDYPEIKIKVISDNLSLSDIQKAQIIDNDKSVKFTAQNAKNPLLTKKSYIFLIENSFFFYKKGYFEELKQSLINILPNIDKNISVNVLSFGDYGDNFSPVRYLSAEPSDDNKLMRNIISSNLQPCTDSAMFQNHLYRSLNECVSYLNEHVKDKSSVFVFLICRGLNLSYQQDPDEKITSELEKTGIIVNVMMLDTEAHNAKTWLNNITENTHGIFSIFQKGEIEKTLAQQMERAAKTNPKPQANSYTLTFTAEQHSTSNNFYIKYGDTVLNCKYTNPNLSKIFGNGPSAWIISGFILIVILVAILYYIVRMKIIRHIDKNAQTRLSKLIQQNRALKKELDKFKKHSASAVGRFDDFNPKENLVGSGKTVPCLMVKNNGEKSVFELTKLVMTIGRNPDNDIVILNRTISGYHATLSYEGGFFYISDNNSTNGVFVNDIRISKNKVHANDVIRFGSTFAKLNY